MNIFLLNPPMTREERYGKLAQAGSTSPPLGLLYIAAVLENDGHSVRVLDGIQENFTADEILQEIRRFQTDLIGLTITTIAYKRAVQIAQIIREKEPGLPIVVGGPDIAARLGEYEKTEFFDYIIYGEGEETIIELLHVLQTGGDLQKIKGLIFKQNGNIVITPPRPFIKDLDSLPFPSRHLLKNINDYRFNLFTHKRYPWTTMVTSRGCPYQCIFCDRSVFGNRFRARSPHNVLQEIQLLKEKYNIKEIFIVDDTFTIDKSRVEQLCDFLIESKLDIIWTCCVRANTVTKELLKKMKAAGCWMIHLGIESGDEKILELLKKGITLEQVKNTVKWANEVGIAVRGFFMLGHLGETKSSIQKTIDFAKSLDLYTVNFCITFLLPNTELTNKASQYGEVNISDFSNMSGHPASGLSFVPKGFTEEELLKYQKKAYFSFYMRPRAIWKIFFSTSNVRDFKGMLKKILISCKILYSIFFKR